MALSIQYYCPLLPAQQEMLAASLADPEAPSYWQEVCWEAEMDWDAARFEAVLSRLQEAFDILRAVLMVEGLSQPLFAVVDGKRPPLTVEHPQGSALDWWAKVRGKGFPLHKQVLQQWQVAIFEGKICIRWAYHHILMDGWGRQQILEAFVALLQNPHAVLPKRTVKAWFEAFQKLPHAAAQTAYAAHLAGKSPDSFFAQRSPQPDSREVYSLEMELDSRLSLTLSQKAKSLGWTEAELWSCLWASFQATYLGSQTLCMGVVRQSPLMTTCADGFGLGIATLPYVHAFEWDASYWESAQKVILAERALLPFSFVDSAGFPVSDTNVPWFQTVFAFENYPLSALGLKVNGLKFNVLASEEFTPFPLSIAFQPGQLGKIQWQFSGTHFSKGQAQAIVDSWDLWLKFLASQDNPSYSDWQKCCHASDLDFVNLARPKTFDFASGLAIGLPDSSQVDLDGGEWESPLRRLERIRSWFSAQDKPIRNIAWLGDKHADLPLLAFAIWELGGCLMIWNEQETEDFLIAQIELLAPDCIFALQDPGEKLKNQHDNWVLMPQDWPEAIPNAAITFPDQDFCAFVVTTSGSTGMPKAIEIGWHNLLCFLESFRGSFPWSEQEVFASIAHPAFDIGLIELIFPLLQGWKQVLVPIQAWKYPEYLPSQLDWTAFHMVPAILQHFLADLEGKKLQLNAKMPLVLTGGDRIPQDLNKNFFRLFPDGRLFFNYGPSECTVLTAFREASAEEKFEAYCIGKAFPHHGLIVLDENGTIRMPYEPGEICILGAAVGRGYRGWTPSPNPFFEWKGQRAYRSGDFGWRDAKGNFYFIGRRDNQVKIAGRRIDLGRVEAVLQQISGRSGWAVLAEREEIHAFGPLVGDLDRPDFEREIRKQLPAFAMPQHWHYLEALPLNKNHKVDRAALRNLLKTSKEEIGNEDQSTFEPDLAAFFDSLFPKGWNAQRSFRALGGHSLMAVKVANWVKKELGQEIQPFSILEAPSLEAWHKGLKSSASAGSRPILSGQIPSDASQRLFFLALSDPDQETAYWIRKSFQLSLSAEKVNAFLRDWMDRNPWLNLVMEMEGKTTLWKHEVRKQIWSGNDISNFGFHSILNAAYLQFCLEENAAGTLLRVRAFHGFLDGIGLQLVLKRLFEHLEQGSDPPIFELIEPISQADSIDKMYWEQQVPKLSEGHFQLPFPHEGKSASDLTAGHFQQTNLTWMSLVSKKAAAQGETVFEWFLQRWVSFLRTYQPVGNLVTGVFANLGASHGDHQVPSMAVNTLPIRIEADGDVLKNWRNAFSHRSFPFGQMAGLAEERTEDGQVFFNTSFLLHHQETTHPERFKELNEAAQAAMFDLSLEMVVQSETIHMIWEWRAERLSSKAMQLMVEAFVQNVNAALGFEASVEQEDQIGSDNFGQHPWQIFESYALAFPNQEALVFGNSAQSYRDLLEMSLAIAAGLVEKGLIKGDRVILQFERGFELFPLLLACIRLEMPYLCLDEELPDAAVQDLALQLGAKQILRALPAIPAGNRIIPTAPVLADPHTPLYFVATSGSTAAPKLVGISQCNFAAAIPSWQKLYDLQAPRVLQLASWSFDVFMGDLGRSIFNGGTLVLTSAWERRDPLRILELVKDQDITHLETTPGIARFWLETEISHLVSCLHCLIVGSDAWRIAEYRKLRAALPLSCRLFNSYGLSETTIDNFAWEGESESEYGAAELVPIGVPMPGNQFKILDAKGRACPHGSLGELVIIGAFVGLGYWDREGWKDSGKRLDTSSWNTGDLAWLDEYGQVHFKGRGDQQVKVRGNRIDLESLEAKLEQLTGKGPWVCWLNENEGGGEIAAASLRKAEENWDELALSRQFLEHFPAYMLPSHWLFVDEWPLNRNGKIDRKQLQSRLAQQPKQALQVDDLDQVNRQLRQILNEASGKNIGLKDNFFAAGLNSFDLMRFVGQWNKSGLPSISIAQVFRAQSLQALRLMLNFDQIESETLVSGATVLSQAQQNIWFVCQQQSWRPYWLPHILLWKSEEAEENWPDLFEAAIRSHPALFVHIRNREGVLIQEQQAPENWQLDRLSLASTEDLDLWLESRLEAFQPESMLPFVAAWITLKAHKCLVFCPHHIVYDGGSDRILGDSLIRLAKGQALDLPNWAAAMQAAEGLKKNSLSLLSKAVPQNLDWDYAQANPAMLLHSDLSSEALDSLENFAQAQSLPTSLVWAAALQGAITKVFGKSSNYISLALDMRLVLPQASELLGNWMQAYPLALSPIEQNGYDWDLVRRNYLEIWENAGGRIIYHEGLLPEAYHQVGLILQHPSLGNDLGEIGFPLPKALENMRYSRLPLTLYVEDFGLQKRLVWEAGLEEIGIHLQELHLALEQWLLHPPMPSNTEILRAEIDVRIESSQIIEVASVLEDLWKSAVPNHVWGQDSHFFEAGGNSLGMLQMVGDFKRKLNIDVPVSLLLRNPRLSTISAFFEAAQSGSDTDALWLLKEDESSEFTLLCPPIAGHPMVFSRLVQQLSGKVMALRYPGHRQGEKPYSSIPVLAAWALGLLLQHVSEKSKLRLVGYSMGALVAFELARMWEEKGGQVDLLLFDKAPQPVGMTEIPDADLDEAILDVQQKTLAFIQEAYPEAVDGQQLAAMLTCHEHAIEHYRMVGKLKADIHHWVCPEHHQMESMSDWAMFSTGQYRQSYAMVGHYDLPEAWPRLEATMKEVSR